MNISSVRNMILIHCFHFELIGLKSQRLSQLLVSDEQNTSAMVMTAIKEIFQAKKKLISQLDEKTIHLFLDEAMYKLVISDINKVGL